MVNIIRPKGVRGTGFCIIALDIAAIPGAQFTQILVLIPALVPVLLNTFIHLCGANFLQIMNWEV